MNPTKIRRWPMSPTSEELTSLELQRASDLWVSLVRRGLDLHATFDGTLRITPASKLTDADRAAIVLYKPELLRIVRDPSCLIERAWIRPNDPVPVPVHQTTPAQRLALRLLANRVEVEATPLAEVLLVPQGCLVEGTCQTLGPCLPPSRCKWTRSAEGRPTAAEPTH